MAFHVDISRPPVSPPNKTMNEFWSVMVETKESKRQTEEYEQYLHDYGVAQDAVRHYKEQNGIQ